MNVLFIHQNFPGQFRHIAAHLARQPACRVLAIGRDTAPGLQGVRLLRYKPHRSASPHTHPYVRSFEDAVLHGQQVLRLVASGRSNTEIATLLGNSEGVIKNHCSAIFAKMGVRDRTQAVLRAIDLGWI